MTDTLMINEIFHSIQGESTWAGLPCTFIRLTGCHLRCAYCDTEYAFHEGQRMTIDAIVARINELNPSGLKTQDSSLVEVTGGEPLLQPNVHPLMSKLCDAGHTVLIETSGACDISKCDPRVIRIMDLKTPGSGEAERNLWSNIDHLTARDEAKFVITDRADYEWAREAIKEHSLPSRVNAVLLSAAAPPSPPSGGTKGGNGEDATSRKPSGPPSPNPSPKGSGVSLRDLAEWILADGLPVRLQTQLHKLIWPPETRGV